MKPTLGIASLFLSGSYEVELDFGPEEDVPFESCAIYDGGKPSPGTLHLTAEPLSDAALWRNGIVASLERPPSRLPRNCHYLHAVERDARKRRKTREARFVGFTNALFEAMGRMNRWALATERQCAEKPDLAALLNLCQRETGMVSLLVDRNLRYLTASESFANFNPWFNADDGSMGTDLLNELLADEAFQDAQGHEEPFFYYYEGDRGSYSACFNVFVNGVYEARLLVQSPLGRQVHGQLAIAEYLGERIAGIFAFSQADSANDAVASEFQKAIEGLLSGRLQNPDKLSRDLAMHNWARNHRYRVYAFGFMEPESESVTRLYYCNRIRRLFENCCAVVHGGVICCVRNLSLEQTSDAVTQQELVLFLRENLCWVGTSDDFEDVRALQPHFREAQVALQMGIQGKSTEWHFRFADYALRYICEQAVSELAPRDLAHPAFTLLDAHDKKHGTELLKTVRAYLQHKFNVSRTAAHLGIHRSSMLARLERIDQLTHFDWGSYDDCVHLALSFLLLGKGDRG